MNILMCKPDHFGIFYEINPWMKMSTPVRQKAAQQQWHYLYERLLNLNATIHLIDPVKGLPDMVFTANAGLVHQQQAWVSSFKSQERQPESNYFEEWFKQAGFEIVNEEYDYLQPPTFEGAGDALFFNDHLFVGHGFRSDTSTYEHPFFKQFNLIICELINPYFYHLDTCFCPLDSSLAMWYPDAFSQTSQDLMRQRGEFIDIPKAEAQGFACNALVIGKQVVIPTGCPETYRLLEEHGFDVHPCEMSEYIKSGGACKCLTLSF